MWQEAARRLLNRSYHFQVRKVASLLARPLSAWKGNSPKSVCKMTHTPAPWPPDGRPETSRLLKVDHYMLHVRTKMRLGGWAAPRQDTDAGRGSRTSGGG